MVAIRRWAKRDRVAREGCPTHRSDSNAHFGAALPRGLIGSHTGSRLAQKSKTFSNTHSTYQVCCAEYSGTIHTSIHSCTSEKNDMQFLHARSTHEQRRGTQKRPSTLKSPPKKPSHSAQQHCPPCHACPRAHKLGRHPGTHRKTVPQRHLARAQRHHTPTSESTRSSMARGRAWKWARAKGRAGDAPLLLRVPPAACGRAPAGARGIGPGEGEGSSPRA